MDIVSHGIIGRACAAPKSGGKETALIVFFAVLPDLFQIPLYIFLGYINNRPFFFPQNSDWVGFRSAYPYWSQLWEIPHSFFFLIAVILPFVLWFKLPKAVLLAYFSHLFVDIFTHTGEWSVKPFFPLAFTVEGFTDAWAWDFRYYPITWIILGGIVFGLEKFKTRRLAKKTNNLAD